MSALDDYRRMRRAREWSEAQAERFADQWGGRASLWWGVLWPRLHGLLPVDHGVDLTVGSGSWASYLQPACKRLTLVDVDPGAIDECRRRFAPDSHVEAVLDEEISLSSIEDASVDFFFSLDSLVYAEADVLERYLAAIADKLSPRGLAFIHHSNMEAFVDVDSGRLAIENPHTRAATVSAAKLRRSCHEAGLACCAQELVNWGSRHLTDCFSLLATRAAVRQVTLTVRENPSFMQEAEQVRTQSRVFRDPFA